ERAGDDQGLRTRSRVHSANGFSSPKPSCAARVGGAGASLRERVGEGVERSAVFLGATARGSLGLAAPRATSASIAAGARGEPGPWARAAGSVESGGAGGSDGDALSRRRRGASGPGSRSRANQASVPVAATAAIPANAEARSRARRGEPGASSTGDSGVDG